MNSTTSTLSVGSTGSQARLIQSSHAPAMYQPVLMKDLGKIQSTIQNRINDLKLHDKNIDNHNTVVGGGVGDDDDKITEQVMDHHLRDLVTDHIDRTNTIFDIAQYMANLKEKHMESELKLDFSNCKQIRKSIPNNGKTTDQSESGTDDNRRTLDENVKQSSEEDDTSQIVIDKRIDKLFKGGGKSINKEPLETKYHQQQQQQLLQHQQKHHTSKSPRQSVELIHSPDRGQTISPIKIVKVKPVTRNSIDSGKRISVSLSRDNSRDHSASRVRRASEGGILKTIYSNQTPAISPGILKRSFSTKSKSPEHQNSLRSRKSKSLSPGTSFDSRSSDHYRLSPHSSFDNRSPDRRSSESYYAEIDFHNHYHRNDPSHIVRSNQSSFESRSPDYDRKRNSSCHSNFMLSDPSHDTPCNYYPNSHYYARSPERWGKRLSKSLERPTPKDNYYAYRSSGLSRERIYRIGMPIRSQSAENGISRNGILLTHSNDPLVQSVEHPTCVECLYQQRKMTQQPQQKGRARQSRARKKVIRTPNDMKHQRSRSKSEESCVDCNDFYEIHV